MTQLDLPEDSPNTSIRRAVITGFVATALLLGTLSAWSASTPIASAIIAQGSVVFEGRNKQVQHRDGGLVAAINITNGDHVATGDVLVLLDDTEIAASLEMVHERLAAAEALQARLHAEQTGQVDMMRDVSYTPDVADYIQSELTAQKDILLARVEVKENARDRLSETLAQINQEEIGLTAQIEALSTELGYIAEEIRVVEPLFKQQLVSRDRISQLRRTHAERLGSLAALRASKEALENRRRDATLQTRQTESRLHEEVVTQRQAIVAEIGQLKVEMATLKEQMERIEIRAPASGIVHEMQISTIGGVIAAGNTILEIVPQNREAAVEVRVSPDQIENVYPGQDADLVPTGIAQKNGVKLSGKVRTVSAAAVPDPQTGQDFFRVEIAVALGDFAEANITPVPGMPLEIYLQKGEHTVLSYLMDPVTSQLRRAFKE